jgi:hypothetical protein
MTTTFNLHNAFDHFFRINNSDDVWPGAQTGQVVPLFKNHPSTFLDMCAISECELKKKEICGLICIKNHLNNNLLNFEGDKLRVMSQSI